MNHHRRHAQRLQALGESTEAFRAEGTACISLKGPFLAERFYPVPFLRPSNDLDLLIYETRCQFGRPFDAIVSGFQLESGYPWRCSAV